LLLRLIVVLDFQQHVVAQDDYFIIFHGFIHTSCCCFFFFFPLHHVGTHHFASNQLVFQQNLGTNCCFQTQE
jgi:hypothetical protein